MGSVYGRLFRISTWGESHGGGVGVTVDGCPPRLALSETDLQPQLDRRRPGQSRLVTPRQESDRVRILSGVFDGQTLGTPIQLMVENEDARPAAYEAFKDLYRPSHADFTYDAKYGIRNWQGGGRASARETVGRVAAGTIAEMLLQRALGVSIVAYVTRVEDIEASIHLKEASVPGALDPLELTRGQVDATDVRCPDPQAAARMIERIEAVRREGDSVGGIIECVVRGLPAGLGEPVFDKLEAELAGAMLSLPATKGFEIGSGFEGTRLRGSTHNDAYVPRRDAAPRLGALPPIGPALGIGTRTNRSGGVQGGISNGEPILFRVAFKPTATIRKKQTTVDRHGKARTLEARGRHDPCVLPRAVPLVEAMTALVLADQWLVQLARTSAAAAIDPPAGGPPDRPGAKRSASRHATTKRAATTRPAITRPATKRAATTRSATKRPVTKRPVTKRATTKRASPKRPSSKRSGSAGSNRPARLSPRSSKRDSGRGLP